VARPLDGQGGGGLAGLAHAFVCAAHGIAYAVRNGRNLRIELVVAVLALVANVLLRITALEWAVIIVLMGLMLACEVANTAIEATVDLASPQRQPLAGHAKDAAAGACLICAVCAVCAGLIIYIHAALRLLG
jgi:diacylglycerol kinase